MQILINAGDVQTSDAVVKTAHDEVAAALEIWRDQITRVEVHLRDLNGPKSGLDKRCTIEARLAGHDPLAVEHDAPDLYQAISQAAGKLERAVRRKIERHEAKRSGS